MASSAAINTRELNFSQPIKQLTSVTTTGVLAYMMAEWDAFAQAVPCQMAN